MKNIRHLTLLFTATVVCATALGAKPIAGPKTGRILTSEAPHVEFLVQPDRTVLVSFYNKDLKPLAPADQVVTATAEVRSYPALRSPMATDIASWCRSVTPPKPSPKTIASNFTTRCVASANGQSMPASATTPAATNTTTKSP